MFWEIWDGMPRVNPDWNSDASLFYLFFSDWYVEISLPKWNSMFDPNLLSLFKPRLHYVFWVFNLALKNNLALKKTLITKNQICWGFLKCGGTPNHPKLDKNILVLKVKPMVFRIPHFRSQHIANWLVVSNMIFIFHNIWDNLSHWFSFFQRG